MHDLARLIAVVAVAAAAVGCGDRTDAPAPTGDAAGLVRLLEARRHTAVVPACVPPQAIFDALVTPPYRGHSGADPDLLRAAIVDASGPVTARVLYADDMTVPANLRRARPVVPVGQPPLIASIGDHVLPALWVFRGGRWRCLVDPDRVVASLITDPPCRAAYEHASEGRCLDLTAAIATAVLTSDAVTDARLCALIVAHGCGSVPAVPSPTPTP